MTPRSSAPPAQSGWSGPYAGPTIDDRVLVERACADPDAMSELYRRYVNQIYGFAYRRTGSREHAEDVTAAVFERALRALPGFRWRGGGFAAWLFRIASNVITDHYRHLAKERSEAARAAAEGLHPPGGGRDDVASQVSRAERDAEIRRALDHLNPRYQRALELRYLAGLDHGQAAAAFGVAKPTFAVVLHRATAALRRVLEEFDREGAGDRSDEEEGTR